MSRASRRGALALTLAGALLLPGCLAAVLPHEPESVAGPPWAGVAVAYKGPSSPGDAPVPSNPWSGSSWWTHGWDLYEARKSEDHRLIREFVGEDANATVLLDFPIYLAGGSNDDVLMERLHRVIMDFRSADFRVVLVATHPDVGPGGAILDPPANADNLFDLQRRIEHAIRYGGNARHLDAIAVEDLAGTWHTNWQILAYHRSLKSLANTHGLPLYLKLDDEWVRDEYDRNGYTLDSIHPENHASDGLILETRWVNTMWGGGTETLTDGLERLLHDVYAPDKVWLLERIPNCDLRVEWNGEPVKCKNEEVRNEVQFWFRSALTAGARTVGTAVWSDGGGSVLPHHGVLRADAEGLTLKGLTLHDFLVGHHDPDVAARGSGGET